MTHVLTFDLGTTYFKAAVFTDAGRLQALARRATPIEAPEPGWVQIQPHTFKTTIAALCGDLRQQQPDAFNAVRAVSFASQTNSFLLLNGNHQPLTPIIVWTDRRAADQARWIDRFNALPRRYAVTGVPQMDPLFAAAKLHRLRHNEPEVWRAAQRFCLISDYLTLWLTGRHVAAAGAAAMTGLLDIHTLRWWPPALETLGIDPALLPRPARAGADAGPVLPEAAETLGLPPGCRLIVGDLDQYAGAVAAGDVVPGRVSETTGTVLAVVQCRDAFDPQLADHGVFQGPAFDRSLYFRMAFCSLSANLLEAYQRTEAPESTFPELDQLAAQAMTRQPRGALDLAASEAGGAPVFRKPPGSPGDGALIIMRAVAQRLDQELDRVCGPDRPSRVTCLGGGARSAVWRDLKRQAAGVAMNPAASDEPTSLGAAVFAVSALRQRPIAQIATDWANTV